mmetsp:Transcript_63242/g.73597  ORF Transcript_63242/g.73597 Transcript_63242/m.73597 type:complete len:262 (+) Transcript_63242:64-849(+)
MSTAQRPFVSRQSNVVPTNSAARQNYAQIKEQEQLNRERKRQEEFASERQQDLIQRQRAQYDHVQSHGYGNGAAAAAATGGDDVEIRVFVRECDPDKQIFSFMESAAVPKNAQVPQGNVNTAQSGGSTGKPVLFGRRATNSAERRGESPAMSSRGEVPQYLVKRKAEMEAEKQAIRTELERQKELAQYPPGHRPVSEDERAAILAKLAARKKELELELGKLPMRFDTMALRQKRQQIEGEMAEVEAATQKFSVKKQLFVPI